MSFNINDGTNGIKQATVKIGDNITKTTGSAGGFNVQLSDGTYAVEASKEGYITKNISITVDAENTSFTISLTSE